MEAPLKVGGPWGANVVYDRLSEKLKEVRSWAGDITKGNRCAVVVGLALKIKPGSGDSTFRGQPSAEENVRNQPFLDKMFVKASDLTARITQAYGPPDLIVSGKNAIPAIQDQKGVIFCEDCWQTAREKLASVLGLSTKASGDDIDLWDGYGLQIYGGNPSANSHSITSREGGGPGSVRRKPANIKGNPA